MLYGKKETIDKIMNDAHKIANEKGYEIVFGAVQGSISRGLERRDSDYDIRFLYKKNSPIHKINNNYCENEVVYRYYPNECSIYDKIAFWEIGAFCSFLERPEMDSKGISVGLYNQFFWTFSSPYVWDPYGLVQKIMPIANSVINIKYLYEYFLKYIEERIDILENDDVILREYVYLSLCILQLKWLMKYSSYPPLYYMSLMTCCDEQKIQQIIIEYVEKLKNIANNEEVLQMKKFSKIQVKQNEYLTSWIQNFYEKAKNNYNDYQSDICLDEIKLKMQEIQNIIELSLKKGCNII